MDNNKTQSILIENGFTESEEFDPDIHFSHNVLSFDSIDLSPESDGVIYYFTSNFYSSICFNCSVSGVLMSKLKIKSFGKGSSKDQAMKKAIENFFNNNTEVDYQINCRRRAVSQIDFKTIHHINYENFKNSPELYELLKDLMNKTKWRMRKNLPAGLADEEKSKFLY